MHVKICGLREPNNVAAIAELAVDHLGFIFYAKSPRHAKSDALRAWLEANKDALEGKSRVGVFVNAEIDFILNTVHDYGLNYVQLHGNESPTYCQELNVLWSVSSMQQARIIKAFNVDADFDFGATQAYATHCPLFLFDTKSSTAGGSGKQWDWSLLDRYEGITPFFLSGGIGPDDVVRIKTVQHPQFYGIDVNSRFEIQPGLKDPELLRTFLAQLSN